ncbi:MAG: EscU/YscU/HrcU family type III secretion system export apparatus switch protein [Roseburia sp.]
MAEDKKFRPNLWGRAEESEKIIEKDKTAVAIAYEPGDAAPKILAAGKGAVAERIIETAKENDVPFYQDSSLAETLSRLKIGDSIPPELYDVVAEILVFVDDMDRLKGKLKKAGLVP